MKYLLVILFTLTQLMVAQAQVDSPARRSSPDTLNRQPSTATVPDTLQPSFADSSRAADSLRQRQDSIAKAAIPVYKGMDSLYLKLVQNPYLQMKEPPFYLVIKERVREDKDEMFYLLSGLMLLLAFIKLVFPRYFTNIFRLFFQPAFRQKQTREQLLQSSLPSLLLNLFFILSGGAFLALLADYYNVVDLSFWILFLNSSLLLLILYAGKFVFLTFAGWVFNVKQAAETYMFVVYLINKIIGVVLLPFIWIIAFAELQIINVAITISLLLVIVLLFYRYVVSYTPVRREVSVSFLHFFFYVLAFEITPLLLIYKSLIIYLNNTL